MWTRSNNVSGIITCQHGPYFIPSFSFALSFILTILFFLLLLLHFVFLLLLLLTFYLFLLLLTTSSVSSIFYISRFFIILDIPFPSLSTFFTFYFSKFFLILFLLLLLFSTHPHFFSSFFNFLFLFFLLFFFPPSYLLLLRIRKITQENNLLLDRNMNIQKNDVYLGFSFCLFVFWSPNLDCMFTLSSFR